MFFALMFRQYGMVLDRQRTKWSPQLNVSAESKRSDVRKSRIDPEINPGHPPARYAVAHAFMFNLDRELIQGFRALIHSHKPGAYVRRSKVWRDLGCKMIVNATGTRRYVAVRAATPSVVLPAKDTQRSDVVMAVHPTAKSGQRHLPTALARWPEPEWAMHRSACRELLLTVSAPTANQTAPSLFDGT